MCAADCRSEPRLQRSRGELVVAWRDRGGVTALADLRQDGCLKARFPRPTGWAEAVMLNSSGGVAAGDALSLGLLVGAGARASFSAQAAERFYRARAADGPATVDARLSVAEGAAAEWLPQESILFDGCALSRRLEVDLAADAWFLGVETLVFGRALMGEVVRTARLRDTIRVRRAGRLVLHDAVRIEGEVAPLLARRAAGGGAIAMGTLIHVGPDAPGRLDALRGAWAGMPEAAASAWDGMLVGRVVAPHGAALRAILVAGLAVLRDGRPLPRVWNC
jgi:urease accessory protein